MSTVKIGSQFGSPRLLKAGHNEQFHPPDVNKKLTPVTQMPIFQSMATIACLQVA